MFLPGNLFVLTKHDFKCISFRKSGFFSSKDIVSGRKRNCRHICWSIKWFSWSRIVSDLFKDWNYHQLWLRFFDEKCPWECKLNLNPLECIKCRVTLKCQENAPNELRKVEKFKKQLQLGSCRVSKVTECFKTILKLSVNFIMNRSAICTKLIKYTYIYIILLCGSLLFMKINAWFIFLLILNNKQMHIGCIAQRITLK